MKLHLFRFLAAPVVLSAMLLLTPDLSWAGSWVWAEDEQWQYREELPFESGWKEEENKWYYYDDAGDRMTGWVRAGENGRWYYFDPITGVWNPQPSVTDEAACHMVENAVRKAGLYEDIEEPVWYQVDDSTKESVVVSLRYEEKPETSRTVMTFTVGRNTKEIRSAAGETLVW